MAEQCAWLARIVSGRRADAEECRRKGDQVGANRATKDALQASALLARYSPKERDDPESVTVTAGEMRAALESGLGKLRALGIEVPGWPA
jgi:hypothetical protein